MVRWSGGPPISLGLILVQLKKTYVCLAIQGITLSGSHAHTRGHGNPHTPQPDLAQPLRSALSSIYSSSPLCVPRWQPSRRSLSQARLEFLSLPSLSQPGRLTRRPSSPPPTSSSSASSIELGGGATKPTPVGTSAERCAECTYMFSVGSAMLSITRVAAPASFKLCRTGIAGVVGGGDGD